MVQCSVRIVTILTWFLFPLQIHNFSDIVVPLNVVVQRFLHFQSVVGQLVLLITIPVNIQKHIKWFEIHSRIMDSVEEIQKNIEN
jgi:hypothetical protein